MRLMNLIDIMQDDHDCPEPPESAASEWTETEVREYFRSGGKTLPGAEASDLPAVIPGQPGGGSHERVGDMSWETPPASYAQGVLTASLEEYQRVAVAEGIPDRDNSLFPPDDALLKQLANQRGLKPFQKLLIGASGNFEVVLGSWAVGDNAAKNGMDLRYFYDTNTIGQKVGARVVAAVRFSDDAAIGKGFWTSAHGGAVETALDEVTAELAKIGIAPLAYTIDAQFSLKKPCPLNTSLVVEATVVSIVSDGLRINTEAKLQSFGPDPVVYATCKVQIVDYGRLKRSS